MDNHGHRFVDAAGHRVMMHPVMAPIQLTEDQVLSFRCRRCHLAGPGATDVASAARAILGAQSQQLPPSLLALSQRTQGRPTAATIRAQLFESPRRLVRTWGQRDTLHVYDPHADWAPVVAARSLWAPGGRGGPMPAESSVDKALAVLHAAAEPLSRTDVLSVAPRRYVEAVAARAGAANLDARRFAAGRLLWRLAHRGDVCLATKVGAEQTYVARTSWFPGLPWDPAAPLDAAADLTRRYLRAYGPATPADVAHFFGARVTSARAWLAELDGETVSVRCGERKGLVALAADLDDLQDKPASSVVAWPVRLLPLWDSMLMGHADKSWTVPDAAERKHVWRKAAFIAAAVLARGRIVATWTMKSRRRDLHVEVTPLSGWRDRVHAASVRREAKAVAAHLELDGAAVKIL